jgi:hypothetical protein
MKSSFLLLFVLFFSPAFGQATFKKELSENKFSSVRKRQVPMEVLKVLGYDSYSEIGTHQTQKGCTSGKKIVLDWAVTDNKGLYVLSVSSCGRSSQTRYYLISGNQKTEIDLHKNFSSFEDFRKAYIAAS